MFFQPRPCFSVERPRRFPRSDRADRSLRFPPDPLVAPGILEAPIRHGRGRAALCGPQDVQGHAQFIMQLEPRMVALGFMAGRESAVERREGGEGGGGGEREEGREATGKKKGERKSEREKRRGEASGPIRGLYSRGMSYMPPAVADALFIARLFIISSSYTRVADSDVGSCAPPVCCYWRIRSSRSSIPWTRKGGSLRITSRSLSPRFRKMPG